MTSSAAHAIAPEAGLAVGRRLPGLADQHIEAIFHLPDTSEIGAVAVSDGTRLRILLLDVVICLESRSRDRLDFVTAIARFVESHVRAARITLVGPGPTRDFAEALMVDLLREFPRLAPQLTLSVAPRAHRMDLMPADSRRLLAGITLNPLSPPAIPRSGTSLSRLKAAPDTGPADGDVLDRIGPELRAALNAVPQAENPIAAYMDITAMITPLPQTRGKPLWSVLQHWAERLIWRVPSRA